MPAATVQKAILSINKLMSYDVPKGLNFIRKIWNKKSGDTVYPKILIFI